MTGVVAILASGGSVSVIATPSSADGSGDTPIVQTNSVTVTVQGGGSFTYLWSYESGSEFIEPNSGLGVQTQSWRGTGMAPGEDRSAIWKCTVLSGLSAIGSVMVPVFVQRF